jgi:hypothetical protein
MGATLAAWRAGVLFCPRPSTRLAKELLAYA